MFFIVYGGSYPNLASTTLVDKLQLKTKPHPQANSIQWLNQGKGLKVSTRCLISLSTSNNYFDELKWMLVMCCWEGLGCMTERLSMMVS